MVVFFRTGVSGSSGSVVGGGGGGGAILLRVQRLVLVLTFARFRLEATDLEKTSAVVSEEEASERAAAGRGLGAIGRKPNIIVWTLEMRCAAGV